MSSPIGERYPRSGHQKKSPRQGKPVYVYEGKPVYVYEGKPVYVYEGKPVYVWEERRFLICKGVRLQRRFGLFGSAKDFARFLGGVGGDGCCGDGDEWFLFVVVGCCGGDGRGGRREGSLLGGCRGDG